MATDFQNITANQRAIADQIITYGRSAGYSDEVISAVLHLANQESDLGTNRRNPVTGAEGIFHFLLGSGLDRPWGQAFTEFKARHPDSQFAAMSPAAAKADDAANIAVAFDFTERSRTDYANGYLPSVVRVLSGGRVTGQLEGQAILKAAGIDIWSDYDVYIYLRHNTDGVETLAKSVGAKNSILATRVNEQAYLAASNVPITIPVVDLSSVSGELRTLYSGIGRIALSNGAEFVLTSPNDSVQGDGQQFFIIQGNNQTWVDLSWNIRVDCRATAVNIYLPGEDAYRLGKINITGSCTPNMDGTLHIVPNTGYRPFDLAPSGKFVNPAQPGVPLESPPMIRADGSEDPFFAPDPSASYVVWDVDTGQTVQLVENLNGEEGLSVLMINEHTIEFMGDAQTMVSILSFDGEPMSADAADAFIALLRRGDANAGEEESGLDLGFANGTPLRNLEAFMTTYDPTTAPNLSGETDNALLAVTLNTSEDPATPGSADLDEGTTDVNGGWLLRTFTAEVKMPSGMVDETSAGNLPAVMATDTTTGGVRVGEGTLADTHLLPDAADLEAREDYGPAGAGVAMNAFAVGGTEATYIDPLVLDLNGDGVQFTDWHAAPVLFDIDNDGGSLEESGWVSAEDGIVVVDADSDGAITTSAEMLSEYYGGDPGSGGEPGETPFADGFEALRSLDSDANTIFNNQDTAWGTVKVWVDADHDGTTDAGELKSLAELNITQINLGAVSQSGLIADGNEVLATGTFVQGGVTREALATSFLSNPNGHTITPSGSGTVVTTQGGGAAAATSAYLSTSETGETIDVATLGVHNAAGGDGDDTLVGDATNNWLAGGPGADAFDAGAGDDVLLIDAEDEQQDIHGGAGTDIAQVVGDAGVALNLAEAELEVAQGGRGGDILIGGGRSSVFIRGDDGDDILIGGAANDALNGENGADLIDGGAGNDILRGGRDQDQVFGGEGDDLIQGGQDDDRLTGGSGNDVLRGEQGDDTLDGGDGVDVAEYSGSFAEYRITRTEQGVWVSDTVAGRDGTDFLTHVEKANFRDVSLVEIPSETSAGLWQGGRCFRMFRSLAEGSPCPDRLGWMLPAPCTT